MADEKFPRYEQSGGAEYFVIETDNDYRIGEKIYGGSCEIPTTESEAKILLGEHIPAFINSIQIKIGHARRTNDVRLKRF